MSGKAEEDDDEPVCGKPCHPDAGCELCAWYWSRVIDEGLWDEKRGMWTDKAWERMTRA